jgi:hypothetical protein
MAINPIQQKIRSVNIMGAAAVVVLLSATAALGVYPMWQKGQGYIREAEELHRKQTELTVLDATLKSVDAQFKETEARLAGREEQLPSWEKEPNFYGNEMTKIKKATGVTITASDLSKDLKNWNGYRVGSIDVRGGGDWDACMKFLAEVKDMKGLTRLDSLVFDAARDGTPKGYESPKCEFRLSFSIFFKGG